MKKILLILSLSLGCLAYGQTARVQLIHNSPDPVVGEVDIYIDGILEIDDFKFRTATPFMDVTAGTAITVSIAPANSTSVADAIINQDFTLTQNITYVVVADGVLSPGYSPLRPLALNISMNGREASSSTSTTDILVHHGSTDAPTVDLVETGVGAGTVVDNISYGEFAGYLELTTDNYVLDVRDETGTTVVATYELPLATLNLQGAAVTAVASGFLNPATNNNGPEFGIWVALPAGGNLIPLALVPLSVKNAELNTFKLYPNPASQNLYVKGLNLENVTLDLVDIQGRKLNTNTYKLSKSNSIDVSGLSMGVYHLIITDDQKNSTVRKFIKN